MLKDRYDNFLSTDSVAARDAYVSGVDRFLASDIGVNEAFDLAIAEDDGFALAYVAKARNQQTFGDSAGARETLAKAQAIEGLTARERAHIHVQSLLINGKSTEGFAAAKAHLADHPRDVLVAQPCIGVLSLIGLSGLPGREAANLAFAEALHPHYGDDWWFQAVLAFAQMECGQLDPAAKSIETSLAANPRNANAAHYRSHLYYENGETSAGLRFLEDWWRDYNPDGLMNCHIAWHVALWSLAKGDVDRMWEVVDAHVDPRSESGPPINVVSDTAAVLYRAELAGVEVPQERWKTISAYASEFYPKPGLAFVDVHAALAHAMAGNSDALSRIIRDAKGPAVEILRPAAEGFGHLAAGRWKEAVASLSVVMTDHARLGGSKAQRDLVEFALAGALLRLGRGEEARRLLQMHRAKTDLNGVITGF